jgi:ATP-binding cassette subfamily F protein uup
MWLKLERACLSFGHTALLDQVDFSLDAEERVALIGRNGTGKSSMLSALAGQAALDDGIAWRRDGARIAHVPQENTFAPGMTVFQSIAEGMGNPVRQISEYQNITQTLAQSHAQEQLLKLDTLQRALETEGSWNWRAKAERLVDRFSLSAAMPVEKLSGGEKKRLALARAFALEPDVLLLDEPTNHLDTSSIDWLEALLLESHLALCFISHDRHFLDRLATRIVELDRGRILSFPGNFAAYQKKKELLLQEEIVTERKADRLLDAEEAWRRKGVEARRTRAAFRVARLEKLRAAREERRARLGQARFRLDSGGKETQSGRLIAELEAVDKAFGEKIIVRNFSARILRGDKIGLIGANGAGKTTLLRLILGDLSPDAGQIRRGTRQTVAYFDQFRAALDPEARLIDVISPGSDHIEIGGTRKHVIGYLEDFLFAPERARSPVKTLSGGEKNRLLLARLFARPANVLVLDEPTNDLDIETLELLEALLQEYSGTLFLVSHDRAFLDQVVTQTLVAEGGGLWREYAGGYSDWQAARAKSAAPETGKADAKPPEKKPRKRETAPKDHSNERLSWKEIRELEALPERIARLEAEQSALLRDLEKPETHRAPHTARALAERASSLEMELLELMTRWEALETRAGLS